MWLGMADERSIQKLVGHSENLLLGRKTRDNDVRTYSKMV
jgi:hypothetical protein